MPATSTKIKAVNRRLVRDGDVVEILATGLAYRVGRVRKVDRRWLIDHGRGIFTDLRYAPVRILKPPKSVKSRR